MDDEQTIWTDYGQGKPLHLRLAKGNKGLASDITYDSHTA